MAKGCSRCSKVYQSGRTPFIKYEGEQFCKECFSAAVNQSRPLTQDQIEYKLALRKHYGLDR